MNITSNLIEIGQNAFQNCKNLVSISIPSSVSSIGSHAFSGCESLSSITIPSSMTEICDNTFNGCISLKTIDLPSNIAAIEYQAFYDCRNLTSIIIPSSVTSIASRAFYNCNSLESVVLLGRYDPLDLKISATYIFYGCNQLRFVCLPSDYVNESFCELNSSRFCKHESCESFLHNQCYHYPVCNADGNITIAKRKNATEWESKSNGCYQYQCLNSSGPVYWRQCNSTSETERVCEDGNCIIVEPEKEEFYLVDIEVDGINVTNLNMTDIINTISNLTNIDADDIRIRIYPNDKDEIISICVIVNDKTKAENITKSINELGCNISKSPSEKQ